MYSKNVKSCQRCERGKKMANNEEEIKLSQTTINGVPLPQTPKAEAINESFNLIDESKVNVKEKRR